MTTTDRRPALVEAPPHIARLAAKLTSASGAHAILTAHYDLRDALKYQKRAWYVCEEVVVWIQWRDHLRVMERATPLRRPEVTHA
jgi:hypothetical protein